MGLRLKNTKHERFAHAMAALTPLATAYREAGFGGDPRWHPYNASKLASRPEVKARIEELRLEFERTCANGAVVHANYVRAQLVPIIEVDPVELYELDPDDPKRHRLRDITKLPPHVRKAISRIKIDENGRPTEIIFASKTEAASTLLRSLPEGNADDGQQGVPAQFTFVWGDPAADLSHDIPLQLAAENAQDAQTTDNPMSTLRRLMANAGRGNDES